MIQLSDDDTIELLTILELLRPTLDAEHGPGFFASTPYEAIRSKFPRNTDFLAPRPREITLSDLEPGMLRAALDMKRLITGELNHPIYEKVSRAIDKRASTVVGRFSLSRAERRANVTGYFGLTAVLHRLAGTQ